MRVWPMLLNLRRLISAVRGRLAQQRSTNRCGRDSVGLQGYWAVPKRQREIHHQMWGFLTVKTRLQTSSRKFSTSLRSAVDLPCLNEEWASLSSLMAWSFDSPSGRSLGAAATDTSGSSLPSFSAGTRERETMEFEVNGYRMHYSGFGNAALSGGGIAALHMATQQPDRIIAMIAISAPPYFPAQARAIQRQFSFASLPETEQTAMRERSRGGQKQIDWLMEQTRALATTYDDVNF